jgi:hypothetical protein
MTMKVFVYKNLNRDCWSIRSVESGLVVSYRHKVLLRDCVFKVGEGGRQRVVKLKSKFVHAGVQGFVTTSQVEEKNWVRINYNPYKGPDFYEVETGKPIVSAKFVQFREDGVYAIGLEWR